MSTRGGVDLLPAPALVLGGILSVQLGAAVASGLIRQVGPVVTVAVRLAVASAVLLLVARPATRRRSRHDWLAVAALGVSLAVMNLCFYTALGRLPLGIVATIEFLGPLGLAALASRRPVDLAAVVLALAGVVAVSGVLGTDLGRLDVVGLSFAAAAGVAWAAYILATRSVGARWRQLDGLALSMVIAAVLVVPAVAAAGGAGSLDAGVLVAGGGVAMLSSVVPYSLELFALRRLDTRVFGILLSLEPAVAALAGLVVLGQALAAPEVAGIALVVAASALVMASQRSSPETGLAGIA